MLAVLRVAPQASALCSLDVPVLGIEHWCSLQPAEHPLPFSVLEEQLPGHVPQEWLHWGAFGRSWGSYSSEGPVDEFALSFLECSGLTVFLFLLLYLILWNSLALLSFRDGSFWLTCAIICTKCVQMSHKLLDSLTLAVFTLLPSLFWIVCLNSLWQSLSPLVLLRINGNLY